MIAKVIIILLLLWICSVLYDIKDELRVMNKNLDKLLTIENESDSVDAAVILFYAKEKE